jgi:hypothetical protein
MINNPQPSYADSMILLGMFIVLLLLVYAYGFEYVRYKTVKKQTPRKVNKLLFGWLALMGLFCVIRISPILAVFAWVLAMSGYLWDAYIVDKMP